MCSFRSDSDTLLILSVDAMRNLPTSDDDKYHNNFGNKVRFLILTHFKLLSDHSCQVSKSSAALDLAHLSQPTREKSAGWPHFVNNPRAPDGIVSRTDRRTVTNPNLTLSTPSDDFLVKPLGGNMSASPTPLVVEPSQFSQVPVSLSRRGSPPGLLDSLSTTTRSVPTTPLGIPTTTAHLIKTGGPMTPDLQSLSTRIGTPSSQQPGDSISGASDIQASLSRLPSATFENGSLNYNIHSSPDDVCGLSLTLILRGLIILQYGLDSPYSLGGSIDGGHYTGCVIFALNFCEIV